MKQSEEQRLSTQGWDQLYVDYENGAPIGIEYPTETLVRYVSNLRKNTRQKEEYFADLGKEYTIKNNYTGNALEFGFGSIANLMMVRNKGFDCYGLEVSNEAVLRGERFLKAQHIDIKLQLWKTYALPFEDNFFSLIYGLGCIYYNLELETVINEIYRTMKPGGNFMFSFFSTNHGYMEMIEHVSDKTYRWSQNHANKRLRGIYLRQPQSKEELLELFSNFKDINIYTWETDELPTFQSFWYIVGKK